MRYLLKRALFVIFIAYFAVDAFFAAIARPIARALGRLKLFTQVRAWVTSLRPYPALALFLIPFAMLEPAKPVAAYLVGTGRYFSGMAILIVAELLKLVLVERLFALTRRKLLKIPAFAWGYAQWRWAVDWLQATAMWRDARRVLLATRRALLRAGESLMPHRPLVAWVRNPGAPRRNRRVAAH